MLIYDRPEQYVVGVDEAGRGSLAGPVVAAACYLGDIHEMVMLNDSKILSVKIRNKLFHSIISNKKIFWGIGIVEHDIIDKINILQATFLAMHKALETMGMKFHKIQVDGNRFLPYGNVPFRCIVKGDGKYMNIAAASILAKVTRDQLMDKLHEEFPMYGWNKNKGYGTYSHRQAIEKYGMSPYHRQSFKLKPTQLKLTFE